MTSLTNAFKTEVMLNMIIREMTKHWPSGLAHMVVTGSKSSFNKKILCVGWSCTQCKKKTRPCQTFQANLLHSE